MPRIHTSTPSKVAIFLIQRYLRIVIILLIWVSIIDFGFIFLKIIIDNLKLLGNSAPEFEPSLLSELHFLLLLVVYQELDVQVLGAFDTGVQMVQSRVEIGNQRRITIVGTLDLLAIVIVLITAAYSERTRARSFSPITVVPVILIILQTAVAVNILVCVRITFILVIIVQ